MSQSQDVVIRPLTPADYAGWKKLWNAYLTFYESKLEDEVYQHTFLRLSDPEYAAMFAYVAEYRGEMVGIDICINHDHGWSLGQVVYLQDLFVDESARKLGLGQALIEAIYAYADQNNKANVYWTTRTGNTTARKLYDRIGEQTDFIKYQR